MTRVCSVPVTDSADAHGFDTSGGRRVRTLTLANRAGGLISRAYAKAGNVAGGGGHPFAFAVGAGNDQPIRDRAIA
ncbi:hypothetical protein FBY14_1024 [Azospirillum brasilense]|nr:hypothetical protein FBY14_1024 [Azospirillum brasilense]